MFMYFHLYALQTQYCKPGLALMLGNFWVQCKTFTDP